jgi:hypothetical protein
MILLSIAALWILGLAAVAGLCIAASRGDRNQARVEPSVDEIPFAAPIGRQRALAGDHDAKLARTGRAAA